MVSGSKFSATAAVARRRRGKGVPFLGEVPIFTEIREGGDEGLPVTVSAPQSAPGRAFIKIAESLHPLIVITYEPLALLAEVKAGT